MDGKEPTNFLRKVLFQFIYFCFRPLFGTLSLQLLLDTLLRTSISIGRPSFFLISSTFVLFISMYFLPFFSFSTYFLFVQRLLDTLLFSLLVLYEMYLCFLDQTYRSNLLKVGICRLYQQPAISPSKPLIHERDQTNYYPQQSYRKV